MSAIWKPFNKRSFLEDCELLRTTASGKIYQASGLLEKLYFRVGNRPQRKRYFRLA
jgi:hypothetical protein